MLMQVAAWAFSSTNMVQGIRRQIVNIFIFICIVLCVQPSRTEFTQHYQTVTQQQQINNKIKEVPLHFLLLVRNSTQRQWRESVSNSAASRDHQHNGKWSPKKYLLPKLQWTGRRKQTSSPGGTCCRNRRKPFCWGFQLYPPYLSF